MKSISVTFCVLGLIPALVSPFAVNPPNSNGDLPPQSVDPACISDRRQQLTFHEFPDYTGQFESFCSSQPDLQSTPGFGKTAIYVCINRGVWLLDVELNGAMGSVLMSGNIGRLCMQWSDNFNVKYMSIRHLASADMDHSAISFFTTTSTGLHWRGPEFYFDGIEMRLREPISGIGSHGLTGAEPFTIYAGTNFDGESECLAPGKNDPLRNGVTFHNVINLRTIGSVKRGCSSESQHNIRHQQHNALVTVDGADLSELYVTLMES